MPVRSAGGELRREMIGEVESEFVFCGECGAQIGVSAKFCGSCGVGQAQFQVTADGPPAPAQPAPPSPVEPAQADPDAETQVMVEAQPSAESTVSYPLEVESLDALHEDLLERRGFRETPQPLDLEDGPRFRAVAESAIGELAGLPVRLDRGKLVDEGGEHVAVRVRIGLPEGNPDTVTAALADACARTVSAHDLGVEVMVSSYAGDDLATELGRLCAAAASAAEVEGSTRFAPEANLFTIPPGFPWWVETADVTDLAPLRLRHLEPAAGHGTWSEAGLKIEPTPDGAVAPDLSRSGDLVLATLMGRIGLIRRSEGGAPGEGEPLAFGSGICALTDRRLVGVLYQRPDDDAIEGLGLKDQLEAAGITARDAAGRVVDPILSSPESHKVAHFVDRAGAVGEDGCGVVLAFSAPCELFERAEAQGGLIQRGLGIPAILVAGSRIEAMIQPFRVLDAQGNTVRPNRGEITGAVKRFSAGLGAPRCAGCAETIEPGSRFCPSCGAPQLA